MFEKLSSIYAVFSSGKMVANPTAWKKGQITGGLVAGFLGALVALAKGFGYVVPLSDEQLLQIGGAAVAVFGLFNASATVVSTDKLGLSSKQEPQPVAKCDSIFEVCLHTEPSVQVVVEAVEQVIVPPVRLAANGDVLNGLDSTYTGT